MSNQLSFKIVTVLLTICSLLIVSGCSLFQSSPEPDPDDLSHLGKEVPDFTYINQDGQAFGSDDLKGHYWLADMIFTNCNTVCPPMTRNMVNLQEMLTEAGLTDVQIVSFSVDPQNDTPESLKEFGEKLGADFSNWNFLTGYEQSEIEDLAHETFMTIVDNDLDSDQVTHGTSFYLIDPNGTLIRVYNGLETPKEDIIETISSLVE